MHAGNGIKKVLVGQHGLMATPAMSALIRRRALYGGLIMSASHNPAGAHGLIKPRVACLRAALACMVAHRVCKP